MRLLFRCPAAWFGCVADGCRIDTFSAALAQFSKTEYGMDETQANIATVLSGGIGLFAAVKAAEGYDLFGKNKSSGI